MNVGVTALGNDPFRRRPRKTGRRRISQDWVSMGTGLRKALLLPGCKHWTQQERPDEVNAALLWLLRGPG